jgi:hypothetical protein
MELMPSGGQILTAQVIRWLSWLSSGTTAR